MTNFCTNLRKSVLTCDRILPKLEWNSFAYSHKTANCGKPCGKRTKANEIICMFLDNKTLFVKLCKKDSARKTRRSVRYGNRSNTVKNRCSSKKGNETFGVPRWFFGIDLTEASVFMRRGKIAFVGISAGWMTEVSVQPNFCSYYNMHCSYSQEVFRKKFPVLKDSYTMYKSYIFVIP